MKKKIDPKQWVCISMDLQQTQGVPKLSNGKSYYKRKLHLQNFCVYDLQQEKAHMYTWEEHTAKRGSVEIYSCLNKWLNDHLYTRSQYPRNLKIFADNCGGQNKNNNIVLALLMNIHKRHFDRIELGFLVPGHSYLACDRKFGDIGKEYAKEPYIPSPNCYRKHIKLGLGDRDLIYHMERRDFLNIETLLDNPTRKAYIRPTKDKVFQKSAVIVMDRKFLSGYLLQDRFNMNANEGKKIFVNLPGQDIKDFDLSKVTLEPKYPEERKLDAKKLKDLEELRKFIGDPDDHQWILDLKESQTMLKQTHEQSAEDIDEPSEGPVDAQSDEDVDEPSEGQVDAAENDSDYEPTNPGPSTSRKDINLRKRKIPPVLESEDLDRIMEVEEVKRRPRGRPKKN